MKKYLEIKNIIIVVLVISLSLVSFDPFGVLPKRTKTVEKIVKVGGQSLHPIHDTIEVEVEVEVPVEVEVEKLVPYAVHDTIQSLVDTTFIVNKFLNSKNVFTNTYKFDKQQGSITITDTVSNNKIVGRKYTTKITPKTDTLRIPEPLKTKVFFGIENGFSKPDVVSHIGAGVIINTKTDKLYHLGIGVANRTFDGTNGSFTPYVGFGTYWKIKLKK